jgi:PAS domain S-box-containing protein
LSLRYDKEELIEDLKQEIARRDRLEAELKTARDDLEMRVEARTAELKTLNRTLEQEIVERRRVEEELSKSEEKYRLLAENATDIVWTLDLKTLKLTYVSPSVEKIRGYSPAEAIELSLDKNLAPDSYALAVTEMEEELRRDREAGVDPDRVRMLQFREFCKDGSIVDTEATIRFLRDVNGFPTGLLGITRDITERRRAEEEQERLRKQLLQAQKMEAIGTLTGGIAHDFNNLLTIINGYTELILLDKTEDDPLYADLKTILETGLKGAEMVKRLLALSKKAPISPQHLDLNRIVDDSVKLMERTFPKMIEIETILGKDPGMVNADPVQVQQVVMNLCINAKEAMPAGGRLRIETRNMTVDDDYCRANSDARPGLFVLIQVSDSGSGIDADTRARIFDPFFTTKGWDSRKGTGLGLSVARGIVEQHGGWMTCESELGVGTTFKIYLPALEAPPEYTKPVAEPAAVAGAERMLLVDDEEYVRDLGKRILERSGYTVVIAANGKEALEIYKREQSNIALVVLDLIMPQMSGEKCLEGLLKINPHVKVIISTGHSLDAKQLQHLGSLAKGFVNKPYEVKQLAQTVRKVLDAQ